MPRPGTHPRPSEVTHNQEHNSREWEESVSRGEWSNLENDCGEVSRLRSRLVNKLGLLSKIDPTLLNVKNLHRRSGPQF